MPLSVKFRKVMIFRDKSQSKRSLFHKPRMLIKAQEIEGDPFIQVAVVVALTRNVLMIVIMIVIIVEGIVQEGSI